MRAHHTFDSAYGLGTGLCSEMSKAEREQVIRFFDETLSTRLDDKRRGRIVVIQQRTHQADLTGHLLVSCLTNIWSEREA